MTSLLPLPAGGEEKKVEGVVMEKPELCGPLNQSEAVVLERFGSVLLPLLKHQKRSSRTLIRVTFVILTVNFHVITRSFIL